MNTKLGTNKGCERSRVWIEGARLTEAGFTVGARYNRELGADRITLTLATDGKYKVSGKGSHPIIDITGNAVLERFKGTHAAVQFSPGSITITNAAQSLQLAA